MIYKDKCKNLINKNTEYIYMIFIIISIFINNRLFHIVNQSIVLNSIQLLIIIFLFCIAAYKTKCITADTFRSFIPLYLIYVLIFMLGTQFINEVFLNGTSLKVYISAAQTWIYILLLFPIYSLFATGCGYDRLLKAISLITSVMLLILLINTFVCNVTGNSILPFEYYQQGRIVRNNRLRIWDISVFTGITSVYSYNRFIFGRELKEKLIGVINFFIIFSTVIYVEQTRVEIMAILCVCVVITLLKLFPLARSIIDRLKSNQKNLILTVVCFCIVVIIILLYIIKILFRVFGTSGENGLLTTVRIYGVQHAIKQFLHNIMFGVGITFESEVVAYNGIQFMHSANDIGIFGGFEMYGLTFIGIYIWPMMRFVKLLLFKFKRFYANRDYSFAMGLFVYLLVTTITYIVTNDMRLYAWPFYIAIFEYLRLKFNNDAKAEQIQKERT